MQFRRSPGPNSGVRVAFTLIELLVVIAIIAILAVVVILALNPAQLLAQSRDVQRLSDLKTINDAINFYIVNQAGSTSFSLGTSSVPYLSVFDPSATTTAGTDCTNLGITNYIFSDNFSAEPAGNINGQNGWGVGDPTLNEGTWSVDPAAVGSMVSWVPGVTDFNYYFKYLANGLSSLATETIQADFNVTGNTPYGEIIDYAPQFWLLKTATSGDSGGYGVYYEAGVWAIFKHLTGSGGGNSYTVLASATSTITIATSTWYTGIFQVTDASGTPTLNFWVFPQGSTQPSSPMVTATDASGTFTSGYFGLGNVYYAIQYTNVAVQASSTVPISGFYHCAASSTYRNVSGNGWIPINFSQIPSGSPIGSLPVDPLNQTSSLHYYLYKTNGSTFRLIANPESQKYRSLLSTEPHLFNSGGNLNL